MLQKLRPYNPCFQISQSILGPTLYSLKKKKNYPKHGKIYLKSTPIASHNTWVSTNTETTIYYSLAQP